MTAYTNTQGNYNDDGDSIVSTIQQAMRDDFSTNAIDPAMWTVVTNDATQSISVTGGNLTITTGTTANAQTLLRSVNAWKFPVRLSSGLALSQRIANQNFYVRLKSADQLCYAEMLFNGTSATSATAQTVNNNGPITSGTYTTVSTATNAIHEIDGFYDEVYFSSRTANSNAAPTAGRMHNTQLPDTSKFYYVEVEVLNGATAPASSTTLTIDFLAIQDISEITAELTGGRGARGAAQGVPVHLVGLDNTAAHVGVLPTAVSTTISQATHFRLVSAAGTNATSIKTSAGQLYSVRAYNTSATVKYVKLHNTTAAPTVGTTAVFETIQIPANGGVLVNGFAPNGIRHSTGIALSITGAAADTDTTAVAAGDVYVQIEYV